MYVWFELNDLIKRQKKIIELGCDNKTMSQMFKKTAQIFLQFNLKNIFKNDHISLKITDIFRTIS